MPSKVYTLAGPDGLKGIEAAGELRVLACLPGPEPDEERTPFFGSTFDASVTPVERSLRWIKAPILNQGSSSACNPHACVTGAYRAWHLSGQKDRTFTPWPLYALINGGRDAGSSLEDAVVAMRDTGLFLLEDVPGKLLWKNEIPSDAYANARRFRIHECYFLRTFANLLVAAALGFNGVMGIPVGRNFNDLDADGATPKPNSLEGYHAVSWYGSHYSQRSGRWLTPIQNSWGSSWGDNGHAYVSEASCLDRNFRAFAFRVVGDDPSDTATDPPLPALSGNLDAEDN